MKKVDSISQDNENHKSSQVGQLFFLEGALSIILLLLLLLLSKDSTVTSQRQQIQSWTQKV